MSAVCLISLLDSADAATSSALGALTRARAGATGTTAAMRTRPRSLEGVQGRRERPAAREAISGKVAWELKVTSQRKEGRRPPPGWLTPPPSPDTEPEGTGEAGSGRLQEHLLPLYESKVSFFPWRREERGASPRPKAPRPVPSYEESRMQATGGNWAPTCKQRCPWGRLLSPSTLRSRASDQMQRGQHVVAVRSRVSGTSRTGANRPAGAAPSPRCAGARPAEGTKGPFSRTAPPPPLLPVPTWRETEKIKLLPVVVKNRKNGDRGPLPKYCSSKQLPAAAGSPSCGRSRGGPRPEGYPLSLRCVRHRFLVPVNCAGFRNTKFASLCPIHSWPGTCTRVHKVLKQNNMLQPMPSDVKGTI